MTTVRLKLVGIKKYCFNPNSFLAYYLFMNEQTRYLMFFRKFTMCRHKYSCFENVVRTLYKTIGLYIIVRTGLKFMLNDKIFDLFSYYMKQMIPNATEKWLSDMGTFIEV